MSHSSGKVYFDDGAELWFEYNGTADLIMPWLYPSIDKLNENWRRVGDFPRCSCGNPPEKAVIEWHYGGGSHMEGTACRKCMVITSTLSPWDEDEPEIKRGAYRESQGPKEG